MATKPALRSAHRRRRRPVSGFYEWETPEGSSAKRPWYIRLKESPLLALAGLWEEWTQPNGATLLTFTIVATSANELIGRFNDRMPVVLMRENVRAVLSRLDAPHDDDLHALPKPRRGRGSVASRRLFGA